MLTRLVKEHQQVQQRRREDAESKRQLAVQSVGEVTTLLMDNVNSGVANVFSNQRRLETETRALQTATSRFAKQTGQWLQMFDSFNTALKEVGDIDNWGKSIEADIRELSATLEYLQKQSAQQNVKST